MLNYYERVSYMLYLNEVERVRNHCQVLWKVNQR